MSDDPVSFERDVKPLFRERDRGAMEWAFDLWSYDDVSANADAILGQVERVDALRRTVGRRPSRYVPPLGAGRKAA
jgi:hypothetical protein